MSEQKFIKSRILQRIDSEQNWTSVNPILSAAEIVFSRTENGTFMKLGDGRHYLDTPFYHDIKIDENQISSLKFVHISKDEYEQLVATSSINESTIYFLSGDLDAYGRQIKNIADGTDLSDAVNLHQLHSAISGSFQNYYTKSETSSSQQLKSEFDGLSSKAETSSLANYMKLSSDQVQGLSSTVEIRDGSSIDFESGSEMNVDTGAQINMRSGAQMNFLNSHSKAVVGDWSQISVRNSDRNLCVELDSKADISSISSLEQKIDGKIWLSSYQNGVSGYTDLSVMKLDQETFERLLDEGVVSSLSNTLFVVDYDYVDAYGRQLKNVQEATDFHDAVTLGQLEQKSQDILDSVDDAVGEIKDSLSGLIQNKADLSALDDYAKIDGLSEKADLSALDNYLPLSGGTLTGDLGLQKVVGGRRPLTHTLGFDGGGLITHTVLGQGGVVTVLDTLVLPTTRDGVAKTIATEEWTESQISGKADLSSLDDYAKIDELSTKADLSSLSSKADLSAVPTKTSELINDEGFITSSSISAKADISSVPVISVDGVPSDIGFLHVSDQEYEQILEDGPLSNVLYLVSSDYNNAYGMQIKNLSAGTDISDAVNMGQLQALSSNVGDLCISVDNLIQAMGNIQYILDQILSGQ